MAKTRKGGSDEDFMATARAQREGDKSAIHAGMVMTHPPVGPSKSIDEVLAENAAPARPQKFVTAHLPNLALEEGKMEEIALDRVIDSKFQVRSEVDQEDLDNLTTSIIECGLVSPLIVRKVSNLDTFDGAGGEVSKLDTFELIAGHTRIKALRKLGWATAPAFVRSMSDSEAAKALTTDNAVRKNLTDFEMWKHVQMLEAQGAVKTVSGLAEVLGCSRQHIYRLRGFAALPDDALGLLNQNRNLVGATLAEVLANDGCCLEHPSIVANALSLLGSGRIKSQLDVMPWIKAQVTAKPPKTFRSETNIQRPGRPDIKIVTTEKETKIRGVGLNQEKLQALIEAHLEELF